MGMIFSALMAVSHVADRWKLLKKGQRHEIWLAEVGDEDLRIPAKCDDGRGAWEWHERTWKRNTNFLDWKTSRCMMENKKTGIFWLKLWSNNEDIGTQRWKRQFLRCFGRWLGFAQRMSAKSRPLFHSFAWSVSCFPAGNDTVASATQAQRWNPPVPGDSWVSRGSLQLNEILVPRKRHPQHLSPTTIVAVLISKNREFKAQYTWEDQSGLSKFVVLQCIANPNKIHNIISDSVWEGLTSTSIPLLVIYVDQYFIPAGWFFNHRVLQILPKLALVTSTAAFWSSLDKIPHRTWCSTQMSCRRFLGHEDTIESVDSQLSQAWLFDHGWRPRSVLSRVLWKMLEPFPQRIRVEEPSTISPDGGVTMI